MRLTTRYIWMVVAFITGHQSIAQQKITLNGYVTDQESGEKLIGASVYVPSLREGVSTNQYGFYSITVPDSSELQFMFVGYATETRNVVFGQDSRIDVSLQLATGMG